MMTVGNLAKTLALLVLAAVSTVASAQQQSINIGTTPDDGTGDTLRAAFDKVNDNFTELYAVASVSSQYLIAANDSAADWKAKADATCDGTNDHAEIQAAITALGAAGGVIELAPGTYYTAGTSILGSNTIFVGNSATIRHNGTEDFCLQIGDLLNSEVTNSHISDLKFIRLNELSGCVAMQKCKDSSVQRITVDGLSSQTSGPSSVSLREAYQCVVRDIVGRDTGSATVVFPVNCQKCTFENIEGEDVNGVIDASSVGYSIFRNIRATTCTEEVMDLGNFYDNVIDSVYIDGTVNGIRLKCEATGETPVKGATRNRISNVYVGDYTQSGVTMASAATGVQVLDYNQFTNISLESTAAASTGFAITNGDVNNYNIGTQINNLQISTSGAGLTYNKLQRAKISNVDIVAGTNGISSTASSGDADASYGNAWSNIYVDVPTSSTTYAMNLTNEVGSRFTNMYLEGGNNCLLINGFAQLMMSDIHCKGSRVFGVSLNPSPSIHRGADDGSVASAFTNFTIENSNLADASNIQALQITHNGTPELDISDIRFTNWAITDTQAIATIDPDTVRYTVSGSGTFSNIIFVKSYRYDGTAINVTTGVTLD